MMISIKQITYALAVAEHLHFRKAAEACHVSQSTLSTALTELEKQLGVTVFERDTKKVLVTRVGHVLLERMQSIYIQTQDLMKLAALQTGVPDLKIGMIPTVCPYLLPKVLPVVETALPKVQLQIVEQQSHVLVDQVRTGQIDAAILALPYPHEGLLSFEFWQEDFVWIAHRDYIALKTKTLSSQDLQQLQLLLLSDGHCLKDHILDVCRVPYDQHLAATSLATLIALVLAKQGTTLIPQMALKALVQSSSQRNQLMVRHLSEPGPHRRIAFIVRPNYVGLSAIETLIQLFRQGLNDADAVFE